MARRASSAVVFCAITSRGNVTPVRRSSAVTASSSASTSVVLPVPFGPLTPIWSCGPTVSIGIMTTCPPALPFPLILSLPSP